MSALAPILYAKEVKSDGLISRANNSATYHEAVDSLHRRLTKLPPADCPIVNRFTPGLYSREMIIPKGTMLIGKVHRTEHQFAVMTGRIVVWLEGGKCKKLEAGHIGTSPAGARRVGLALMDTRWITFHPTTETDLKKLEELLVFNPLVEPKDDPEADKILRELRGFALEDA